VSSRVLPSGGWVADLVAHPRHGPLPAALLILTISTGLVDAVSILSLGRVFVANMTGNIVFIGFALAKAPGFSLQASAVALGAFLVGAGCGGLLLARRAPHRGRWLRDAALLEVVLLAVAVCMLLAAARPYGAGPQDVAVGLAGAALGLQNAVVRALAVPDLTTTVLTMTLTGIAADLRTRNFRTVGRRVLAVVAMLAGALIGALLVKYATPALAMAVAAGLVAVVAVAMAQASRAPAAWQSTGGARG
jgi:uncharacterized membrane protein YoaK (UPF0700 family)